MPDIHHKHGPSSAYQWLPCPGSLDGWPYPEDENDASRRGTLLHKLTEQWCTTGDKPEFPDEEAEEFVTECYEYVQGQPTAYTERYYEVYFEPNFIEEFGGTCDVVLLSDHSIHVIDYKFGRKKVYAAGNLQLLSYLVLAREEYGERDHYAGSILQPAVSRPQYAEFTNDDLDEHLGRVFETVGQNYRQPGGHCEYCPLLATCNEAQQWALKQAQVALDDELSVEECDEILTAAETMKALVKQVKLLLMRRIMRGEDVPGYKVGKSKGNRKWADEDAAAKAFLGLGMSNLQLFGTPVLKSPAQIEKLCKLYERPKSFVNEYTVRPNNGPRLVDANSRLEDWVPELDGSIFDVEQFPDDHEDD